MNKGGSRRDDPRQEGRPKEEESKVDGEEGGGGDGTANADAGDETDTAESQPASAQHHENLLSRNHTSIAARPLQLPGSLPPSIMTKNDDAAARQQHQALALGATAAGASSIMLPPAAVMAARQANGTTGEAFGGDIADSSTVSEHGHDAATARARLETRGSTAAASNDRPDRERLRAGLINDITPFDVLLGKGRPNQDHPGNLRMHQIVNRFRSQYINASRPEKPVIAKLVLALIREQGNARFLRRVDAVGATDLWEEVSNSVAQDKISHAFRNRPRSDSDIEPRLRAYQTMVNLMESSSSSSNMADAQQQQQQRPRQQGHILPTSSAEGKSGADSRGSDRHDGTAHDAAHFSSSTWAGGGGSGADQSSAMASLLATQIPSESTTAGIINSNTNNLSFAANSSVFGISAQALLASAAASAPNSILNNPSLSPHSILQALLSTGPSQQPVPPLAATTTTTTPSANASNTAGDGWPPAQLAATLAGGSGGLISALNSSTRNSNSMRTAAAATRSNASSGSHQPGGVVEAWQNQLALQQAGRARIFQQNAAIDPTRSRNSAPAARDTTAQHAAAKSLLLQQQAELLQLSSMLKRQAAVPAVAEASNDSSIKSNARAQQNSTPAQPEPAALPRRGGAEGDAAIFATRRQEDAALQELLNMVSTHQQSLSSTSSSSLSYARDPPSTSSLAQQPPQEEQSFSGRGRVASQISPSIAAAIMLQQQRQHQQEQQELLRLTALRAHLAGSNLQQSPHQFQPPQPQLPLQQMLLLQQRLLSSSSPGLLQQPPSGNYSYAAHPAAASFSSSATASSILGRGGRGPASQSSTTTIPANAQGSHEGNLLISRLLAAQHSSLGQEEQQRGRLAGVEGAHHQVQGRRFQSSSSGESKNDRRGQEEEDRKRSPTENFNSKRST